tara:strand:- start:91 stop:276 length:186 start_codon:yes stop_codon:yes gene_type:complete
MDNVSMTPDRTINSQQTVAQNENTLIYSDTLFRHGDVVLIQHKGEQYRLRRTRQGKLILTK